MKYIFRVKLDVIVNGYENRRNEMRVIMEIASSIFDGETQGFDMYYKGKVPIHLLIGHDSQYKAQI